MTTMMMIIIIRMRIFKYGSMVLFDTFVSILSHNLAEPAYEADVAQLEYKVMAKEHGLTIRVKGFNHKLPRHTTNNIGAWQMVINREISNFDQWIWEEIQKIEANEFCFQEQTDPIEFVENICENMHLFEKEDLLTGDQLLIEYNAEIIADALNHLTPEKVNIFLLSPSHEGQCSKKEKWFGAQYCMLDIDSYWSTLWRTDFPLNPDLHLPQENKYIATDFSVKETDTRAPEYPTKIINTREGCLWYKEDNKFGVPKVIPVKEIHSLNISWALPPQEKNYNYHVYPATRNTSGILGFSVTVTTQATKYNSEYVDKKIEEFFAHFEERLRNLSEEEFLAQTGAKKLKDYTLTELLVVIGYGKQEGDVNVKPISIVQESMFSREPQLTFLPSSPLLNIPAILDIRSFISTLNILPYHKILK
ncbi:PREDICTED: nardilysin-like [Thamnophis sirtalis]|uniref:Nardilysin-like n=1 Tax=Thamnophis sirtalis TaxID=35019 RepID=A0A6I9YFV3_9SAUR|nr:PREDICTED: nardilysin-like [Thamnophis sirtalis]